MSAPHGCTNDMEVVETFKEALRQRVGGERYQMWFARGVEFSIGQANEDQVSCAQATLDAVDGSAAENSQSARGCVLVRVRGQFALDRLKKNFLRELRGAALQASGSAMNVELRLQDPPAQQCLPLLDEADASETANDSPSRKSKTPDSSHRKSAGSGRGRMRPLSSLIAATDASGTRRGPRATRKPTVTGGREQQRSKEQLSLPAFQDDAGSHSSSSGISDPYVGAGKPDRGATVRSAMTLQTFVCGTSNQLASTAVQMVCQDPGSASPLFLCGPTGTGKSHALAAIADQWRRRHRMRRVMHLTAEQFTNDFISSVASSGITSFRRRYRDIDALLIDDVQFLGSKTATLRELLYTLETLSGAGRPMVFSGLHSPTEIRGLSQELAGRMAAGLVCPIHPLDQQIRETLLRERLKQKCQINVPEEVVTEINAMIAGDGRVIGGVVNKINLLQRMLERMPTMDEIYRFAGDMLRATGPVANLTIIESAVCEIFQLPVATLRSGSQTRAVTEPRMLAMYLSRQLTSSAYAEIAKHYGGKSHSTAMAAEKNVKAWLEQGKLIGRGQAKMSAQEALDRVEISLRAS